MGDDDTSSPLTVTGYLQRILTSRVYDLARETPLERAAGLSRSCGATVLLKREDTQPSFSFKVRGAFNKMAGLTATELARGVICASAGNHAQGVALAARHLGCPATVVMPTTTPRVKVDAVTRLGARVELHGDTFDEAAAHAAELESSEGAVRVHPFDDPDVIAGQGTIAMELLRQHPAPIDAVFVPVGGGGLIAGIAAYTKAVRPDVKIIGVEAADSDAMVRSVRAGRPVELADVGLFSDGTAVKRVGVETFRLARELVDDWVTVSTDDVCAAIKDVFEDTRTVVEPAGALAVAGLKKAAPAAAGATLIAVVSGANMGFDRLRFVADRAEEREALFAVTIPERRGSFRRFAEVVGPRAITEFNYRVSGRDEAHVFVGLATGRHHSAAIVEQLESAGFPTLDLTENELAKDHVRHMVGGHSPLAEGERLLRVEFPERPGALLRFLSGMHQDWNISLFHYRNQGGDQGRVLVGLQGVEDDDVRLGEFLTNLGYPSADETHNEAYRQFLR